MKLIKNNLLKIIILFIMLITLMYIYNYSKINYELLTNKNDTICPIIELPCNPGPQGDRGPAGGDFQEKGPLRNLDPTVLDKVVDTTNDNGGYITTFLNDRTYKPEQTWTLNSSKSLLPNKLVNQSGNCINVDKKTDVVGWGNCKDATEWVYTSQGLLKPKTNSDKDAGCLTYVNSGTMKKLLGEDKMGGVKNKSLDEDMSVYNLSMAKCSDKNNPLLNQQWSFN